MPGEDSNLDQVIQSHSCYHYTTRQNTVRSVSSGIRGGASISNSCALLNPNFPGGLTSHLFDFCRDEDGGMRGGLPGGEGLAGFGLMLKHDNGIGIA